MCVDIKYELVFIEWQHRKGKIMQKCQKTIRSRDEYVLGPTLALCVNWDKIPSLHGCSSTDTERGQRMWTPIVTLA